MPAPTLSVANIGILPGDTIARSMGVNADGSVVVGISSGATSHAFRWTAPTGMQPVQTLLTQAGVADASRGAVRARCHDPSMGSCTPMHRRRVQGQSLLDGRTTSRRYRSRMPAIGSHVRRWLPFEPMSVERAGRKHRRPSVGVTKLLQRLIAGRAEQRDGPCVVIARKREDRKRADRDEQPIAWLWAATILRPEIAR